MTTDKRPRTVWLPIWIGILLLGLAFALAASSVDDRVAFAVGTAGAVVLAVVSWPRRQPHVLALSWLISFVAALAAIWAMLTGAVAIDPMPLAAGFAGVMLGSLLLARVLRRG